MAVGTDNASDAPGRLWRASALASARRAAGLLLVMGFLSGCAGSLDMPAPSQPLRAASESVEAWRKAGFGDPVSYPLPNHPANAAAPISARIARLTYLVESKSAWTRNALFAFARNVPARFAECGISFDEIGVVETELLPASGDRAAFGHEDIAGLGNKLALLDGEAGLTVLFIDTLDNAQSYADAGGVAFVDAHTPFAVIARKVSSGRLLQPEQIVAHEIGHLLGLEHVPATTPDGRASIDLMHPRGCLHCGFSERECETMRKQIQLRDN